MRRLREPGESWWRYHRETLIGIVLASLVLVAVAALLTPSGSPADVTGLVTGFRPKDPSPDARYMQVRTASRSYTVATPYRFDCRAGDRVALTETPYLWGRRAQLAPGVVRPCRAPRREAPPTPARSRPASDFR